MFRNAEKNLKNLSVILKVQKLLSFSEIVASNFQYFFEEILRFQEILKMSDKVRPVLEAILCLKDFLAFKWNRCKLFPWLEDLKNKVLETEKMSLDEYPLNSITSIRNSIKALKCFSQIEVKHYILKAKSKIFCEHSYLSVENTIKKAIQLCSHDEKFDVYFSIAENFYHRKRYKDSIKCFSNAFNATSNPKNGAKSLFQKGLAFYSLGDFSQPYKKAHEKNDLSDYQEKIAEALNSLGMEYYNNGQYFKAVEFFDQAYAKTYKIEMEFEILKNKGDACAQLQNIKEAFSLYKKAKEKGKSGDLIGSTLISFGHRSLMDQKYKEVAQYFTEALEYRTYCKDEIYHFVGNLHQDI